MTSKSYWTKSYHFYQKKCILINFLLRKPEPEICNVRCPPLGCPRGPCPGMCCYEGICDPCCMSKMPKCPPPPHPPRCCAPPSMPCPKSSGQKLTKPQTCMPNPCDQNSRSPCCTTTACSHSKFNNKSTTGQEGFHQSSARPPCCHSPPNNNNSCNNSAKPACPVVFWSV